MLTPQYWDSITSVSFNFTPFADNNSGIGFYEWGLGSAPGTDNVIPFRPANATTTVLLLSLITDIGTAVNAQWSSPCQYNSVTVNSWD